MLFTKLTYVHSRIGCVNLDQPTIITVTITVLLWDGIFRYLVIGASRVYMDATYFFVSCFFCLVCSLHILKLRHYLQLLQAHLRPPTPQVYIPSLSCV